MDPEINGLEQSDPELLRKVRKDFLEPPSVEPYNFTVDVKELDLRGVVLSNRTRRYFYAAAET